MADKLEDLRTFVAVIDSGGVNAAAAALGIAKSAVSRRLGELEARLGATLVERSTRSFEPTALGRRYYDGARAVLDAVATLDAEASASGSREGGRTVIAAGSALGAVVASAVAPLPREPEATVEIVDSGAVDRADIWIGAPPPTGGSFDRLDAGTIGMRTVAAPGFLDRAGRPSTFADLRASPGIVISGREDGGWRFGDEGVHAPRAAITVPDDASALAAALAGAGLARLPATLVGGSIRDGRLEQVLAAREPAPSRVGVWLQRGAEAAVRRLADHLAAALRAMP